MERLGRMTDAGRAVLPEMHDKGGTIWNVIVHPLFKKVCKCKPNTCILAI